MWSKRAMEAVKVLGAVGLNGSGKDTVVDYLSQKHGWHKVSLGDITRELAIRLNKPLSSESLHEISKQYIAEQGNGFFSRMAVEKIRANGWRRIAVSGIRSEADALTFQNEFESAFFLVLVECPDEMGFKRMVSRSEDRDPKSFEDFLVREREEEEIFKMSKAFSYAKYKIVNGGTLEEFHSRINELVSTLGIA
jgi:dephospho-CoA kinase